MNNFGVCFKYFVSYCKSIVKSIHLWPKSTISTMISLLSVADRAVWLLQKKRHHLVKRYFWLGFKNSTRTIFWNSVVFSLVFLGCRSRFRQALTGRFLVGTWWYLCQRWLHSEKINASRWTLFHLKFGLLKLIVQCSHIQQFVFVPVVSFFGGSDLIFVDCSFSRFGLYFELLFRQWQIVQLFFGAWA